MKTRYHGTEVCGNAKNCLGYFCLRRRVAGGDCEWDSIDFRRISRITCPGFLDISTGIYAYEKILRALIRGMLSYLHLKRPLQDFVPEMLPRLPSNQPVNFFSKPVALTSVSSFHAPRASLHFAPPIHLGLGLVVNLSHLQSLMFPFQSDFHIGRPLCLQSRSPER